MVYNEAGEKRKHALEHPPDSLTKEEVEVYVSLVKLWTDIYPGTDYPKEMAGKGLMVYRVIRQCMVEAGWIKEK